MTVDTGKHSIIGRVDVAVRANRTMMRLLEPSVVEGGAKPIGGGPGGVAGDASGRIHGGDVVGNAATERLGALPGCKVAAVAVGVGRS